MSRLFVFSLLIAVGISAAPTALLAQSPTQAEQAQLQQMRAAAARQGIALTPEMEAQMLKRMREVQANLLGTQMALKGFAQTQGAVGNAAPASTGATQPPAQEEKVPADVAVTPVSDSAAASPGKTTYVYLAPADNDPSLESIGCGVKFGFHKVVSNLLGMPNGLSGTVESQDGQAAVVTVMRGDSDYQFGTGVRTQATLSVEKSTTTCKLSIQLLDETPFKTGPLKLWKAPDFTAAGVLENTAKFYYRPSIEAPYPPDALLANFDRLAVKGCSGVGHALSRSLDGEGNRKNTYCIKLENGEYAPAIVECFPYRNGSKCAALTVLPAKREGKVFDAVAAGSQFKGALEAVVND